MDCRKCFICSNDTMNSPGKIYVRVREDLRENWCRLANVEYFRISLSYCCEDHIDVNTRMSILAPLISALLCIISLVAMYSKIDTFRNLGRLSVMTALTIFSPESPLEILKHEILEFRADTLRRVREAGGLGAAGRGDEAVDLLLGWLAKQEHLRKKDLPRIYLETTLIMSNGSIEKSKKRIDMICTMRTLAPQFFAKFHAKRDFEALHDVGKAVLLPKLTDDHCRVGVLKLSGTHYASFFQDLFQYIIIICEYTKLHDYCNGFVFVVDPTDINIMEFITKINLIELRDIVLLATKGYGARIESIHFVSPSKAVEVFITMVKQVISAKIMSRVSVQKTLEELHLHLPKRILPSDLGGEERSTEALYDEWLEVYSREEHVNHMREMQEARTDESRRRAELNDAMFGLPGTFRTLNLD